MSLVTRFCGVCGDRVPPADLTDGRAVIANDVTYCEICAERAGLRTGAPVQRRSAGSAGSSHAPVSSTASRRPAHGAGRPRRAAPRRPAPGRPTLGRAGPSRTAPIVTAIGVALVLGVVGFIAWPRSAADESERTAGPANEVPSTFPEELRAATAAAAAREFISGRLNADPGRRASLERLIEYRDQLEQAQSEFKRFEVAGLDAASGRSLIARLDAAADASAGRVDRRASEIWDERQEAVESFLSVQNYDRALAALERIPAGFERTDYAARIEAERRRIEAARQKAADDAAVIPDEGWEYISLGLRGDGWSTDDALRWKLALDDKTKIARSIEGHERKGTTSWLLWDGVAESAWTRVRFDVRIRERGFALLLGTDGSPDGATRFLVLPQGDLASKTGWTTIEVVDDDGQYELMIGAAGRRRLPRKADAGAGIGFEFLVGSWFGIRNVRVRDGT